MAKKTDHQTEGKQERFWCPRCKRSLATDKRHLQCPTCGDPMPTMREWVRKQARS